jgi:formate C-acetyltransferase
MAAFETLLRGQGQPAIYNDDLYVRTLEGMGVLGPDAAEFVFGGCSETHIAGKSSIRDGFVSVVDPLLKTLGVGPAFEDGLHVSPREDPGDFGAFLDAYKRNVRGLIDEHVARRNATQRYVAKYQPALVRSIFVSGCIEKGMSHSEGGALYNHGMIDVYGIPNVANSLYVIKRLVYEDQELSLDTLRDALTGNWGGYGDVRLLCLRQARYGNDVDEVDWLACEISDHIFSYIQEHKIWNGGIFYGFCASAPGQHVTLGQQAGATPDGRLAGRPLANSMGPAQGTDGRGPTAALNSVSKLDLSMAIGTPVVNLSFERRTFRERGDAMIALVRTFFEKGGMQLQFNVVDRKTLTDALEHPEEYGDLIVRVSGYSACFSRLPRAIQEEIVERTVH